MSTTALQAGQKVLRWEKMATSPAPIEIQGKTEQRIALVVKTLRKAAPERLTYDELGKRSGSSYDVLLYIVTTLVEVGLVTRQDEAVGPGRPRCFFTWIGAQETGS